MRLQIELHRPSVHSPHDRHTRRSAVRCGSVRLRWHSLGRTPFRPSALPAVSVVLMRGATGSATWPVGMACRNRRLLCCRCVGTRGGLFRANPLRFATQSRQRIVRRGGPLRLHQLRDARHLLRGSVPVHGSLHGKSLRTWSLRCHEMLPGAQHLFECRVSTVGSAPHSLRVQGFLEWQPVSHSNHVLAAGDR